jgi:hypothetical protein
MNVSQATGKSRTSPNPSRRRLNVAKATRRAWIVDETGPVRPGLKAARDERLSVH